MLGNLTLRCALAISVIFMLALAGCGTHVPYPRSSAMPSGTDAPCLTTGLAAGQGTTGGAVGTSWAAIVVTNDSPFACYLSGTPTIHLMGSPAVPLPTTEHVGPPSVWHRHYPASRIPLRAAQSASFTVVFADNAVGNQSCPEANVVGVTFPGIAGMLWATTHIAPCGGLVFVLPIRAGTRPVQEPSS
jgi:hypothetical protein